MEPARCPQRSGRIAIHRELSSAYYFQLKDGQLASDQWNDRNELLNAFRRAFFRGTHGLIDELAFDLIDDGSVVVCGVARSYYGIQLALHTTKQFGRMHRSFPETRLLLNFRGKRLELVIAQFPREKTDNETSTRAVGRRPQLTIAELA